MIRNFIIYFLVSVMTIQLSHKMLFVLHYSIYKQEIAASKCVNKDKPKLKCNGKCHLKKKLEEKTLQNPNNDLPLPGLLKKIFEQQTFYLLLQELNLHKEIVSSGRWAAFYYSQNYRFSFLIPVFHPPEIIDSIVSSSAH